MTSPCDWVFTRNTFTFVLIHLRDEQINTSLSVKAKLIVPISFQCSQSRRHNRRQRLRVDVRRVIRLVVSQVIRRDSAVLSCRDLHRAQTGHRLYERFESTKNSPNGFHRRRQAPFVSYPVRKGTASRWTAGNRRESSTSLEW